MPRRIRHHVADDVDASLDPLVVQPLRRPLVGAKQEVRQPVDLDADVLLGHRPVTASHARLDVRERSVGVARGARSRERRGRVAEDENPIRTLGLDGFHDPRLHFGEHLGVQKSADPEAVARLRQVQLVEENLGQLGVVVLPRVQRHLVDSARSERDRERRSLDELGSIADDGGDFHGATVRAAGR